MVRYFWFIGFTLDQPFEVQYPALTGHAPTKISYDYHPINGMLANSITDRAGNITSFSYDILLRNDRIRSSLNQPAGPEKVTTFDRLGRVGTLTDEEGNVTTKAYDIFDQISNVTLPDHTVGNPRIQAFTYNAYGLPLTQSGAGDYPVTYTYDLAGNRLTLVTQYGSGNTNQTTTWTYNSRNRVTRKTYANNTFYDYTFDENGNLKTRKDAKNQTTIYSYNLFNQVGTVDYPTDSDVIFTYDSSGRRLSMTDGSRSGAPSTEWTYDIADRIFTYKQHPVDRVVTYGYNAEGSRTSMSVEKISAPGSPWVTAYTYDAAGRLDTLADSRVGVIPFDYTWDPKANLVKEILMPSGAKQQRTYDGLARLSEIKALSGSDATVNRYTYTYDAASQRKDVTLVDSGKITYGYDAKRQLTSAVKDNEINYDYSFTFDNIGNWLTGKTGQSAGDPISKTFTPNNLNQYSHVNAVTQTYDANGSLINDGTRAYTYDQENRLTAVAGASFIYDGLSRRVASGTTKFLYDGLVPVAELDATNDYTRTVTRGLDLGNSLQRAGGVGGILSSVTASIYGFYFYDGNGNVVDVFDGYDVSIAHYVYDPFGNKLVESGVYKDQPYQWSTKEFDVLSELVCYQYRFYNSALGRWLNRDPIREQGGINLFCFVGNDPVGQIDPMGLAGGGTDSWKLALKMFAQWLVGDHPVTSFWGQNDSVTKHVKDSNWVDSMRKYYLDKNKGKKCSEWLGVDNMGPNFTPLQGEFYSDSDNGIIHFMGGIGGAISVEGYSLSPVRQTILSMGSGGGGAASRSGMVSVKYSFKNTTSVGSLLGFMEYIGFDPDTWNVTDTTYNEWLPGDRDNTGYLEPMSNWNHEIEWTEACPCSEPCESRYISTNGRNR